MLIVRMVNGFLDPEQNKKYAVSIRNLAVRIELPRILVDIRHEATHQQLPSLQLLISACREALSWIQSKYWEVIEAQHVEEEEIVQKQLDWYERLASEDRARKEQEWVEIVFRYFMKNVADACSAEFLREKLAIQLMSRMAPTPNETLSERRLRKLRQSSWETFILCSIHVTPLFVPSLLVALFQSFVSREAHQCSSGSDCYLCSHRARLLRWMLENISRESLQDFLPSEFIDFASRVASKDFQFSCQSDQDWIRTTDFESSCLVHSSDSTPLVEVLETRTCTPNSRFILFEDADSSPLIQSSKCSRPIVRIASEDIELL
jgi:hypothetical protein